MIEEPEITRTAPQRTAVIRLTVPRTEIQEVMGAAIGEVLATVERQGVVLSGPVFSRHFRIDPEVFDFEVGVPVTTEVRAAGRVEPGELPPATVARTTYRGPYEGLGGAWGALDRWIVEQGRVPAPGIWESYVSGPESGPDSASWRTELYHPLADSD